MHFGDALQVAAVYRHYYRPVNRIVNALAAPRKLPNQHFPGDMHDEKNIQNYPDIANYTVKRRGHYL